MGDEAEHGPPGHIWPFGHPADPSEAQMRLKVFHALGPASERVLGPPDSPTPMQKVVLSLLWASREAIRCLDPVAYRMTECELAMLRQWVDSMDPHGVAEKARSILRLVHAPRDYGLTPAGETLLGSAILVLRALDVEIGGLDERRKEFERWLTPAERSVPEQLWANAIIRICSDPILVKGIHEHLLKGENVEDDSKW